MTRADGATPMWQVATGIVVMEGVPVGLSLAGAPVGVLWPWVVPTALTAAGIAVAARLAARQQRQDRLARGWGLDPDASTPERPFAATACPGREREFEADSLSWSRAGCPTPPRTRPLLWCPHGHPAVYPVLGLLSPVGRLFGRLPSRWVCPQGHRGTTTVRPGTGAIRALVAAPVAVAAPVVGPAPVAVPTVLDVREVA